MDNVIIIDEASKVLLEYIEKLRGNSTKKRQKLNQVPLALRPSDFPGISTQQLSDILIRFAYNGSYVDQMFRKHVLDLVVDTSLTWNQVIHSVINTKVEQLYIKSQLCELIREMIRYVQIKSFDDKSHADSLILMIRPTVFFLTKLILDLLDDEDELDTLQIEYEDALRAYHKPLEALNALLHDELCSKLLSIHSPSEITEQLQLCLDAFSKLHTPDKSATTLMELLLEKHIDSCKSTDYQYVPEGLALFGSKNPTIRILVSIFACFKSHESSKTMAATIQTFAEIMRVSGDVVIFDLVHAALLLKCEESMDSIHVPKHHRRDFRWHSTTFFYIKLPEIIKELIERGGKVTADDVRVGLERTLNDLTMMFDAADVIWQNASFLTLLKELEPSIGNDAAETLRERRRKHMESTANLIPLAETDSAPIENTETAKLLAAVKEVLNLKFGQTEEFWNIFIDKINKGNCDDFDAVTSILTAEGRLLEAGGAYAMKNKQAQQPSGTISLEERMRSFDDTFLLLSRIIINNPSLSISIFLNGGLGKSEAEQTILYKWSMWYVKRVARNSRTDHEVDTDTQTLRKEAELLVRLANTEVGIDDDEEEEEEIEVKVEVEPITESVPTEEPTVVEEEMPLSETEIKEEQIEEEKADNDEEKEEIERSEAEEMDTSETKPESLEAAQEPIEQKEEVEVTAKSPEKPTPAEAPEEVIEQTEDTDTKKADEDMPVTWLEVHCPFPRVTKKAARVYLSQLKEGHPFWQNDDSELNIGLIVAAIPRIGRLLVEEHEEKRHRVDRKAAEEHMTNILIAIDSLPCLFICLVQWLDCEPNSSARTSLASIIKSSLNKRIATLASSEGSNYAKWKFVQNTVQHIIDELTDKSHFPEVGASVFSSARRFCPILARNEKPDQYKLKYGWYYMRQQSWASPHALLLLEHTNLAGEYNIWSHNYINKTIKTGCAELMKNSADMVFSFMIMDDLNSIIRIHESLIDFWLNDDGQGHMDGRFDPLSMRIIIRLISHVMLLGAWRLDRLEKEGPPLPDVLTLTEVTTPEPEDPLSREKWVFLLRNMLDRTINRFFKILQKGLLCTVVNTIIQLVKSIAGTANCDAKRLLLKRISPNLIFQLAYIEPASVTYEMMNVFCDPDNEEHTQTKIMFLCALRRAKLL